MGADRYAVDAEILSCWDAEFRHHARDLDLADPDDKVRLVIRITGKASACRVALLIGLARAWGINLAGNTGRADAVRRMTDGWIRTNR